MKLATLLPAALLVACAAAPKRESVPPPPPPTAPAPISNVADPTPAPTPTPTLPSDGHLPGGTTFEVRDIAEDDAYFSSKDSIIGLTCTVTDEMHQNDPGTYGGGAKCSDGLDYYFYAAILEVGTLGTGVVATPPPVGDRDADGIIDSRDSCPDSPEDRDMDKDYDGCPE